MKLTSNNMAHSGSSYSTTTTLPGSHAHLIPTENSHCIEPVFKLHSANGHHHQPANQLVRVVSFDNNEIQEVINAAPMPMQQSCLEAQYVASTLTSVTQMARQASHVSTRSLMDEVVSVKEEFKAAGLIVSDDKICDIASQRLKARERMVFDECQERRRMHITERHRAQDHEQSERHHQDTMHSAKEDKEWLGKLQRARDKACAALATWFCWTLVGRIATGLLYRQRQLHYDGLGGTILNVHYYVVDQCKEGSVAKFWSEFTFGTPSISEEISKVVESGVWTSIKSSMNVLSDMAAEASAAAAAKALKMTWVSSLSDLFTSLGTAMTSAPCYGFELGLVVLAAVLTYRMFGWTKDWSHNSKMVMYGIYAIAVSGLTPTFVGIAALVHGAYMMYVVRRYSQFVTSHTKVTPTTAVLSKAIVSLENLAGFWGWVLPCGGICAYSISEYLENISK